MKKNYNPDFQDCTKDNYPLWDKEKVHKKRQFSIKIILSSCTYMYHKREKLFDY